ncbi:hypothetical protein [Catellatospora sp. NPDC049133]|uniref:hypothetical protein n=1 Tax=Catellatospora sp. NPDC049133 TaxID=3155499 RepID=UPI0033CC78BE
MGKHTLRSDQRAAFLTDPRQMPELGDVLSWPKCGLAVRAGALPAHPHRGRASVVAVPRRTVPSGSRTAYRSTIQKRLPDGRVVDLCPSELDLCVLLEAMRRWRDEVPAHSGGAV